MPHFDNEKKAYQKHTLVGGGDEAGRGPLAGPVVAAIVILDPLKIDERIDDSKKLSASSREALNVLIKANSLSYGLGLVSPQDIDKLNIYQATKLAFVRAYEEMKLKPDFLLLDAIEVELPVPQLSLIKGDCHSYSIAAASILAKVHRDKLMETYHQQYPYYGFNSNKGYGTKFHLAAIKEHGACALHRRSFRPLSQLAS